MRLHRERGKQQTICFAKRQKNYVSDDRIKIKGKNKNTWDVI